jgi:hypothetical protein
MLVMDLRRQGERGGQGNMREVWRTENIPSTREGSRVFVDAFQQAMGAWMQESRSQIEMMEAVEVEANRVADILEWSFQARLDQVCHQQIGTKKIGPKPVPHLDTAMRMLDDQRVLCERVLKKVMAESKSTSAERARAVELYRKAKKELFQATRRRKELAELETFRQIEEKQADSKLFWARAKRVTGRMRASVSPPAMVEDERGNVESDPIKVLQAWRRFSEEIATGTREEEDL